MSISVKVDVNYMTLSEYRAWLAHAKPGESATYAVGYLPRLRGAISDIHKVADIAWGERVQRDGKRFVGTLHLTQKRLGDFNYEYRVTKDGRAEKPSTAAKEPLPLAA